MDITIGIRDVAGAVSLSVDMSSEEINALISDALASQKPLVLTSSDNETVFVPAHALGYVQISGTPQRRVGFGFA
ncbi:DUF3107 domain-containing protein [Arcanobacterium pinnipediorum]|uniref:DUF3107 domain-containing protein n=1 Tax=Arcanobacterium pinnipediorum TaxID=1503041 RepID=A0ABY5AFL5_9ACTO|nr:DUF3107 domain-containing protein [Arcanobacterium pinnipediorum]USR78963.1 DUF3107 domain-containing protein [Arcanobacterium pinnipediorum]